MIDKTDHVLQNNTFLLGQEVHKFKAASPFELYLSWMRQWPEAPFIRYQSIGNSEVLLVNTLAAHREVQHTKNYSFVKPAFFARLVGEIVGKGLLFAEGEEHKKQRRLLAGACVSPIPSFQRVEDV
jgi:cytochrome P450